MLQDFYLKCYEEWPKTRDGESEFIKGNGAIVILTAYPFILRGSQDSLVGRWTGFDKIVVKIVYFSKSINDIRVKRIYPRRWSTLIGFVSILL